MPLLSDTLLKIKHFGKKSSQDSSALDGQAKTNGGTNTHTNATNGRTELLNQQGQPLSKNQARKFAHENNKRHNHINNEKQKEEAAQRSREDDNQAHQQEPEEIRHRYGDLPLVQSRDRKHEQRAQLETVSVEDVGQEIIFRCRIHTVRKMSAKMAFVVFRQQLVTIQGVVHQEEGAISQHMVQWIERIPTGSIIVVRGQIKKPDQPVTSTTKHDIEISIRELHVVSRRPQAVPFTVYEDEVSKDKELADEAGAGSHITDRARLTHRIIDLRTSTSKAIFRINSGVCSLFRSYLDPKGFIEIHTPKLQGGATESGSSVFQLNYFGRPAFLAQSPQLAKQMCIAAEHERVYEIGPVFRAENSNTHRHLTEYTDLDLEMAIEEHYHEALEVVDGVLKHIFKGIYERFHDELQAVKRQFQHEDLVWLDETPRIPFKEGVKMLINSGWTDESGNPPSPLEDLHTRDEIRLGELIKEKYHTDYYILDKFPAAARPFYTMPDPDDPKYTNSFDLFLRGQEILTGGQRIHDAQMLEEHMIAQGVDPSSMEDYMEGFRYAAPPHAGAGIGLERIVMLMLQLGNIRFASLFHRDPKSLPAKPQAPQLRHPIDNTLHPPWEGSACGDISKMQPLENLIANYGDATNTSWTEDRNRIWRHGETGAAVSWVPVHGHAILPGNPLCDESQYTKVASAFLRWLKKEHSHLKPIWVLVGLEFEEVLGSKFGWKTLTCAAEERVDATRSVASRDHDVARKIRHAEKEGITIKEFKEGEEVPNELRSQTDDRIQDWLAGRKGKQVHISNITPWRDMMHRRYFFAQDREGKVHSLVVLAQLSPRHGYQVKFSLDFPGAPSGTIEHAILHAIQVSKDSGTTNLTFGGAASSELHAGHHMSGMRMRMLQRTYKTIAKEFKLTQKSDFRQKLGGEEDPIYVCYPSHGLGLTGGRAIVGFFEEGHEDDDD